MISEQKSGYQIDLICELKQETKLIIKHVITQQMDNFF